MITKTHAGLVEAMEDYYRRIQQEQDANMAEIQETWED